MAEPVLMGRVLGLPGGACCEAGPGPPAAQPGAPEGMHAHGSWSSDDTAPGGELAFGGPLASAQLGYQAADPEGLGAASQSLDSSEGSAEDSGQSPPEGDEEPDSPSSSRTCMSPLGKGPHRGRPRPPKSSFRGVSYDSKKERWRVQIKVQALGPSGISVGYFGDEVEAARAYDRAALSLLGTPSQAKPTNFPKEEYELEGLPDLRGKSRAEVRQALKAERGKGPRKRCQGGVARTSRFIGVGASTGKHKWQARILVGQKVTHLGYHESEAEAARVYDRVALGRHGPGTPTNFPAREYTGEEVAPFGPDIDGPELQRRLGVKPMNKSSRFRGVSRKKGRWEAKVMVDRAWVFRELYDDEEEAARAYDAAVVAHKKPKDALVYVNFKAELPARIRALEHAPKPRAAARRASSSPEAQPGSFPATGPTAAAPLQSLLPGVKSALLGAQTGAVGAPGSALGEAGTHGLPGATGGVVLQGAPAWPPLQSPFDTHAAPPALPALPPAGPLLAPGGLDSPQGPHISRVRFEPALKRGGSPQGGPSSAFVPTGSLLGAPGGGFVPLVPILPAGHAPAAKGAYSFGPSLGRAASAHSLSTPCSALPPLPAYASRPSGQPSGSGAPAAGSAPLLLRHAASAGALSLGRAGGPEAPPAGASAPTCELTAALLGSPLLQQIAASPLALPAGLSHGSSGGVVASHSMDHPANRLAAARLGSASPELLRGAQQAELDAQQLLASLLGAPGAGQVPGFPLPAAALSKAHTVSIGGEHVGVYVQPAPAGATPPPGGSCNPPGDPAEAMDTDKYLCVEGLADTEEGA